MAEEAKGPAMLWLLVPNDQASSVVAINADYRDVRVSTAEGEPFAENVLGVGMSALLIGEKYGSYAGIIGEGPLLSRYTGLDENAIRARIRRKHPKWSDGKVARAVRDIVAKEAYNAVSDHAKRDYRRMWQFLHECVLICARVVMVYDPGRTATITEVVSSSSALRQRLGDAQRVALSSNDFTALYSIEPYEFYAFEDE